LDVAWDDPLSPNNIEQYTFGVGTTSFNLTHQYLDDNPSATPSDIYTVDLTLTDAHGSEDADTATVTVNNVSPVITSVVNSAPEVGDAAPRNVVAVAGLFTDVATLDTHTTVIDWGDGTITSALINEAAGSFSGTHAYATGGIYDIVVRLSDDDSETVEEKTSALVTGVRVKDGELQVVGTQGNDRVEINQVGKKLYKVHADFLPGRGHFATFDAVDVESIRVLLGDGNDHATIADNINLPVFIDGAAGNDHLNAGRGPAVLIGGEGNDKLIGSCANDRIFGGNGNDVIFGSWGNDLLDGGAGNDRIFGSWENDTILGGDGKDTLFGGNGNDTIDAGAGDDWVFGGRGNDIIAGGAGNDVIFGGSGDDKLNGGSGNDRLYGGSGNDVLDGGDGNDQLCGGRGKDILMGGEGYNKLKGGHGNDVFINSSPSWAREFVLNLGADDRNPNSDICVMISGSVNERSIVLGGRRKVYVG
jgi:Ca2+-binding RTX toxin-like protein